VEGVMMAARLSRGIAAQVASVSAAEKRRNARKMLQDCVVTKEIRGFCRRVVSEKKAERLF